jgi:hypothetical protein
MTDQKPPIPFYYDEFSGASNADRKKKTTVDHQEFKRIDPNDNNASTKIKLNCIGSNGNVEDLLLTVHQFKKAVPKMAGTTGPKKFDNFALLLEGNILDQWDRIVGVLNHTNDNFNTCINNLIKYKVPKDDAFFIQKEHLQQARKTRNISVSDFSERLEDINMISVWLPGRDVDDEVLSDNELTRILFRAMPKAWKDEFRKSNYSLANETFASLREKMIVYEELAPGTDGNNSNGSNNSTNSNANSRGNNNRSSNSGNNSNNSNRNNCNNRNSNNTSKNNNNNRNSSNSTTNNKVSAEDTCPIHGGHKWKDFF